MRSRLKTPWLVLGCSLLAIGGLSALLLWKVDSRRAEPIILLCAVALREPIEEIVPIYEQQTGERIEVRFGASRKILTDLELTGQGDLFLPADDSYIDDAQRSELLGEVLPLVWMNGALVVNVNFSKPIAGWNDLFRHGTRFALANPDLAAISRLTRAHLGTTKWRELYDISVEMGSVAEVANAVNLGTGVDAGIIWDNMLTSPHYRHLKQVKTKELEGITATVKIGVVKGSPRFAQAYQLARFINSNCAHIFRSHGFVVADGQRRKPMRPGDVKP
jgi:molybdate transport system substrate-binding protein